MKALEAGLDKNMASSLLRHQGPHMIEHCAGFQAKPLKDALDKVQDINESASHLTATPGELLEKIGGEGGIRTHP